jgi:uncharacterized protein YbjT (DUF2867 family)
VKALVIGGTGFTGSYVVPRLVEAGIETTALVRPSRDASSLPAAVPRVEGSMDDAASLDRAMRGRDTLVCIASIGFGHAPAVVAAARKAGIRRALFISTTAIFTTLNAASKTARLAAEKTIQESGLDATILRPTMIYGSARDRNMARLVRFLRRWPVMPIPGSGRRLMQPIYVDDVARAVVDALQTERTIGRAYNIAGAAPLTFDEIVDTAARLLRRRVRKLHLPLAPAIAVLRAAERAHIRLPVRAEQLLRLEEDKAFAWDDAARDFGFSPRAFADGLALEIAALQLSM